MEILSTVPALIPATALGYLAFRATSHPNSRIRKKLPNVKVKRVQVFPVFRMYLFGRVFHFHHWFAFSIILITSIFYNLGIFDYVFTKGLLLGGVIQGLTLPKGHKTLIYKDFSLERLTSIKHNQ